MNSLLKSYYEELGIESAHLAKNQLAFCEQASLDDLEVVDIDLAGRPFILTAEAAVAWRQIHAAAVSDNIVLNPASGFRSYLYQKNLIQNQLAKGRSLVDILTGNAIPGFSEHHTGQAVDVCADPSITEDKFHETETFRWMLANAPRFNFRLSYPQDNQYGMIFEPWHWLFIG